MIVGAGPTGLVLALWLTKLGVKVGTIDKTAEPGTNHLARFGDQARTLELYRQLDLAGAVVSRGHKVPAVNLWVRGEPKARLPFETIGADLSPYAFLEIFPQDRRWARPRFGRSRTLRKYAISACAGNTLQPRTFGSSA